MKDLNEEIKESVSAYFIKLGEYISSTLNKVGYKLCKGEVMASNQKWNQPLSVWKNYFSDWVNNSDPQSIMEASIFFDFRGNLWANYPL